MVISKILNNNSAVVLDHDHQEVVVIGKGIAYRKKPGDQINPAAIDKKFCLSSQKLNTQFQDVIVNLPIEEIAIVSKIIKMARLTLSRKISDSIYISLSDHIHFALRNHEKGIFVKNNLMFDIIRFYPAEYEIGSKGLEIIQQETGVQLPNDEAGFIALHIVNAQTENGIGTGQIERSTKIIEEILDIVMNYFDTAIKEDSLTYYRFVNHLRYFSQRVVSNNIFTQDAKDEELLQLMKQTYKDSYLCAMNIKGFIKGKYSVDIGEEELLYLVIHIQRAIYNQ